MSLRFGGRPELESIARGLWAELDEWPDVVFSAQSTTMDFGGHRIFPLCPYNTFHYSRVLAINFCVQLYNFFDESLSKLRNDFSKRLSLNYY
jgi:hypothetical protein